jgi:phosphoribosyl 1,2-cyclic phosphodiesterase
MSLRTFSLQSGSRGNCIFVEANNTRIFIDAGISGRAVKERLAAHHIDPVSIDAALISHDHSDHVVNAGVFQRMFDLDLWMTRETADASLHRLGKIRPVNCFTAGESFSVGNLKIETVKTPHDGVCGVNFIIDTGAERLGIFTDLGHIYDGLIDAVCSLDAVYIESNFDENMLQTGLYPHDLKIRVAGERGHISNVECAKILKEAFGGSLRWASLAHLSQENNTREIALDTIREYVDEKYPVYCTDRNKATLMLTL